MKKYLPFGFLTFICFLPWIGLLIEVEQSGTTYLVRYIAAAFTTSVIWAVYCVCYFKFFKENSFNDSTNDNGNSDLELSYDSAMQLNDKKENYIFLMSIESLDTQKYICSYGIGKIISSWQMELVVKYSDDDFRKEISRIKKISDENKTNDVSRFFNMTVYVEAWKDLSCYLYALVDEKDKHIIYVYLQNIKNADIVIDRPYLPSCLQ